MSQWGKLTDCGTVACAAGTCGLDPWFRARGFTLDFDDNGIADISDVPSFFGFEGSQRIFYNAQPRPVETVLGEVRDYLSELRKIEAYTTSLKLPAIGAEWPEQGGHFAGVCIGVDGAPDYLLIVGPEYDGYLNWQRANEWAGTLELGEFTDYTLFNRREGAILFDRVRSLFKTTWYWTNEQHARYAAYAWFQYFGYGDQGGWRKGSSLRVRAVRRIPIQSFSNSVISGDAS
jgi:hypothetical protein